MRSVTADLKLRNVSFEEMRWQYYQRHVMPKEKEEEKENSDSNEDKKRKSEDNNENHISPATKRRKQ